MIEQSEEDIQAINEGAAVKEMTSTDGWRLVSEIIGDKLEAVRLKRNQSDDPAVVMSCVRQEDGIMFVNEVIQEFITLGDEAAARAAAD